MCVVISYVSAVSIFRQQKLDTRAFRHNTLDLAVLSARESLTTADSWTKLVLVMTLGSGCAVLLFFYYY